MTASTSPSWAAGAWAAPTCRRFRRQNIVALCDVDWNYVDARFADIPKQLEQAQQRLAEATDDVQTQRAQAQIDGWLKLQPQLPKAKRYTDYREMLEKQKNIDAVVIATPDHTHAHIALAAMDLGKHVYVQKPLAWSVEECRRLAARATETKLQTQMGNQGHSSDDARLVNEYIQSGAIGTVTEVHVWTNRPLAYWPQGIPRPAPLPPERAGPAVEHEWCDDARRGGVRLLSTARQARLGPVPRAVALGRLPPYLPPVQLARLDRLGSRRHRRHGRAPHRLVILVAGSGLPDHHRDHFDALQQGHLPGGVDDLLRIRREGCAPRA